MKFFNENVIISSEVTFIETILRLVHNNVNEDTMYLIDGIENQIINVLIKIYEHVKS